MHLQLEDLCRANEDPVQPKIKFYCMVFLEGAQAFTWKWPEWFVNTLAEGDSTKNAMLLLKTYDFQIGAAIRTTWRSLLIYRIAGLHPEFLTS